MVPCTGNPKLILGFIYHTTGLAWQELIEVAQEHSEDYVEATHPPNANKFSNLQPRGSVGSCPVKRGTTGKGKGAKWEQVQTSKGIGNHLTQDLYA